MSPTCMSRRVIAATQLLRAMEYVLTLHGDILHTEVRERVLLLTTQFDRSLNIHSLLDPHKHTQDALRITY